VRVNLADVRQRRSVTIWFVTLVQRLAKPWFRLRMRRLLRLVGAACALAACGGGGLSTSSGSSGSTGNAWVAGHLPDGFAIISADERDGRRSVGYAPTPENEYQVLITASSPEAARPSSGREPRPAQVRGHDAALVTLTDEGHPYGFAVAWDERSDLHVVVEGSNGPSEHETLAVAEDVHTISDTDWQKLLIELSPDTHVGRVDPTATPVEASRGRISGDEYILTALVPGGFPLGSEDHRLDCFHLAFRGETTKDFCPGHPIWARVGGQLFAFGDTDAGITKLRITGIYGSSFDPFTVDVVPMSTGPRTGFYVAPLPDGACSVSVDDANGGRGPGETGPLVAAGADYTRCTGLAPGQPPTPPTTAK
jgi:hypothetical protein